MDIYEYNNYVTFLNDWILSHPIKGIRSKLATSAQCNPSWLSRALSGEVLLTPDQALAISQFIRLNEDETEYFLLMVEYDRSATLELKKRIQTKLLRLSEQNKTFKSSIKSDTSLFKDDHTLYYSSWIYAAIHVACMIKPFTVESLSQLLGVSEANITSTSEKLIKMGLILKKTGKFISTEKNIHLSSDDTLAPMAHTVWRNKMIQYIQDGHKQGLHYSGIHCLSKKNILQIKKKLKETVVECRNEIDSTQPETLAILCLDWYEING